VLFRVFPWTPDALPTTAGGALFVPRAWQGAGRHDNPDSYGALYLATSPVSAVAERLQAFRGTQLRESDLRRADGRALALARLDDSAMESVVDLDEPLELTRRGLRPSGVATRDRTRTQPAALRVFEEGASGLRWWSTLEASWINVTAFADRALPELSLAGPPQRLTVGMPAVAEAAGLLGVRIT
jgi:hypothetical protein